MASNKLKIRQVVALALMLMMITPVATLAGDGKKHFKQGLKYEENQQWDKAAEQFALAAAEKPSNVEYQLHLQRALLSAGIMLVKRGDNLAEQKDFNAAYEAYRQAYAYDPTNELALIKARRMLEAQGLPTDNLPTGGDPAGPSLRPKSNANDPNVKAIYTTGANNVKTQLPGIPGRRFTKTDVIYRDTPLLTAIEQLSQTMKLNVMFDQQVVNMMRSAKITVELRDVTYPKALEMLLKTNNLMYAQIDSRTIVVASDNPQSRMKFEPYSVRTFYIKNADLQDVRAAIQGTLPQTKSITPVKQLNALIIRDTPANLELIDQVIDSLDKSKAEVLVDVNIYEVTRDDLLQIGNQFNIPDGSQSAGPPLGGIGLQGSVLGKFPRTLTGPFAFALGLPTSTISFFQNKGKSKLLASTQVHVVDNEQNTIRIGQRVPIQTASFFPTGFVGGNAGGTSNTAGTTNQQNGVNPFFNNSGAFPQIQYENVGLNIDITPNVYEDEVQMKMKIESSSVDNPNSLTPIFSQKQMSSVARIKDGQTTLIAGVSQNNEAKSVRGLPLIGLIPILGRFFATPGTTNRQSDVIITVTPHILRRADIREEDHLAKASGDGINPNNQLKIDQILYMADIQDAEQNQVAAASGAPAPPVPENKPVVQPPVAQPSTGTIVTTSSPGVVVQPVPTTARPNIQRMTVDKPGASIPKQNDQQTTQGKQPANRLDDDDDDDDDDDEPQQAVQQNNQQLSPVVVSVRAATATATKGQDLYVAIILNGSNDISSAHISLSYDPNVLEAKSVRDSGLMRSGGTAADLQFTGEGGLLNIQMDKPQGAGGAPPRGQLCLIVFTVKNPGQSPLTINEQQSFFRTPNGQMLPIKVQSAQVEAK